MKFDKVNLPDNLHLDQDKEHLMCPRGHPHAPSLSLPHPKSNHYSFTLRIVISNARLQVNILML